MNYYNEVDAKAAAWLRELIKDGLIADGYVDERSIEDVIPTDLAGYAQCHFFAGIGGWSLALRLAGFPDDLEVWTGSCPCQPFSAAGKGGGFADERHLWPAWHWLIAQCRPAIIFGEQVESAIRHGWLDLVQADLEACGYAFAAAGLPAACVGAPHIRQRVWFVAEGMDYSAGARQHGARQGTEDQARDEARMRGPERGCATGELGNADMQHQRSARTYQAGIRDFARASEIGFWSSAEWLPCSDGKARPVEPGIFPLVAELRAGVVPSGNSGIDVNATSEARVMRLRGYGNAINPAVGAEFIKAYL